ncbi:hypothetical protein GmRootV213_43860 [Variovorax sp. V213]
MGQFDQHALREPAVQVELERVAPFGAHPHAAAQGEQVLPDAACERMDFLRQEFLDAGGARQEKRKIVHKGFAIIIGRLGKRHCRRPGRFSI